MVRRKSVAAKARTRRLCRRRVSASRLGRSWRVVLLVIETVRRLLKPMRSPTNMSLMDMQGSNGCQSNENNSDHSQFGIERNVGDTGKHFTDAIVVHEVMQSLLRKTCRQISNHRYNESIKASAKSTDELTRKSERRCHVQKTSFKRKYHTDISFRRKHIHMNKLSSFARYHFNNDFRSMHISRCSTRTRKQYNSDDRFRTEHNARLLEKYHSNDRFRAEHNERLLEKYHSDPQYRSKHNVRLLQKYHSNETFRRKMIADSMNNYAKNSNWKHQTQRKYQQARRIVRKYALFSSMHRENHRSEYHVHLQSFRRHIKEGPDCVCLVCRLTFFRNQVLPCREEKYLKRDQSHETAERIQSCLRSTSQTEREWICRFCSDKLKRQQVPSRAIINRLEVGEIPMELKKLNDLERHLIALRLPFMKIVNLISGKIRSRYGQKGTTGPLHCVPADVEETAMSLPRPVNQSMMIRLQLKRRLKYKAVWEEQWINPNDIREALLVLKEKHPAYANIRIDEVDENYLATDCENVSVEEMTEENEGDNDIAEEREERKARLALGDIANDQGDDDQMNEDEHDIRTKFNLGTASCIQPMDFNDPSMFDDEKDPLAVAPAEKNKLSSLLTDQSIEKLAFPHLFPDGRGSFDEERMTKVGWKEYCKARLFSADQRFAADANYIFYLQYLGDLKQAYSGSHIAFRKQLPLTARQSGDENNLKLLLKNDMIYRYLQSVRGSPQYWNQRLKDLFSMNRQLGIPTFFVTLSCADLRWKEFVDVMARYSGQEVKENYSFEEKAFLVRNNPVLAARMFERRFSLLMNMYIKGGACCLGKVNDWFGRVEMQMRGSPHTHMPLWIEQAPKYNGKETDDTTMAEIVKFCDRYIMTRLPSKEDDAELRDIIREVQTHSRNHSKSCLKFHKTICRFGFPRPVSRRTFIVIPYSPCTDEESDRIKESKQTLRDINIRLNEIEKEKELNWIDFDNVLIEHSWTYEQYEWCLTTVHSRSTLIHKREPNARWVNQYNEAMLRAWNANMDIQFVLDPYACARYLMSYTTKPEREMSLLLEATHKECREGNVSVREEMKKLTGTFFNHRQVSVQEAVYRATKMPLTYSSRGFVFVPSHPSSCKFLKPREALKCLDPDDQDIYMSNLADKYFDRPDGQEFDICMADFASGYEVSSRRKPTKNPRTSVKHLKHLNFTVKKRCDRGAIIRFPYFDRDNDVENYFENLLSLYLPIRSREELKKPYQLFYEKGQVYDRHQQRTRNVRDIVCTNRQNYEANFDAATAVKSMFDDLTREMRDDEWLEIVANAEREQTLSKENDSEENPDFDMISPTMKKCPKVHLKQTVRSTNEMRPLLESMNDEQQRVFYHVRNWCLRRLHDPNIEPIRLFITGGAGTGKSHLLKCIQYEATKIFCRKKHLQVDENVDVIHTLITAFTGAAAVNVDGVTIHSAFGISSRPDRLHEPLSCDKLSTYRCKLGSLKLLFIDEISLVPAGLWGAMHARLQQIMGMNSNKSCFGNVGVIAIGDFYQCPPVGSSSVYRSMLWSDHFECVELNINERQKGNRGFSEMLNRIRKLKKNEAMTKSDRETLERCHRRYLNHEYNPQALHLFAKNADVDAHNDQMLARFCNGIRSFDPINNRGKPISRSNKKMERNSNAPLRLAINARVMITKNISVIDGIANGVTGHIVRFIENGQEVSHIVIKCNSSRTGQLHRSSCKHCRGHETICVVRENDNDDIQSNDSRSNTRKQFPLRLSWAMTVHKAQGLTVDELVLSTKDLFAPGMGYTGFSRQRNIEHLFLKDLHLSKIYCDPNVDDALSRMKRLNTKTTFRDDEQNLNVVYHNIEGLECNITALRNHHLSKRAHLILLAETWTRDETDEISIKIDGYRLIHRTRIASFLSDHPLKSVRHGGVAVYIRNDVSMKNICPSTPRNLEYISIESDENNVALIVCYRSPQQKKKEFLANLVSLLNSVDPNKRIMIVGDMNENSFDTDSRTIDQCLSQLGFIDVIDNVSTTDGQTSLDCIYLNFVSTENDYAYVGGSFYSYHQPIHMSFKLDEPLTKITRENRDVARSKWRLVDSTVSPKPRSTCVEMNSKRKIREETRDNSNKKRPMTLPSECLEEHREDERTGSVDRSPEYELITGDIEQENTLRLLEKLSTLGLCQVKILGDGNCFFRAVSDQLYNHERDHLQLRMAAVNHIAINRDDFSSFLTSDNNNIDQYIRRMRQNGTYADHLAIRATSLVIKRNIVIHRHDDIPSLIPSSENTVDQIHISYHRDNRHYDSVRCLDGSIAQLSTTDLRILD